MNYQGTGILDEAISVNLEEFSNKKQKAVFYVDKMSKNTKVKKNIRQSLRISYVLLVLLIKT